MQFLLPSHRIGPKWIKSKTTSCILLKSNWQKQLICSLSQLTNSGLVLDQFCVNRPDLLLFQTRTIWYRSHVNIALYSTSCILCKSNWQKQLICSLCQSNSGLVLDQFCVNRHSDLVYSSFRPGPSGTGPM